MAGFDDTDLIETPSEPVGLPGLEAIPPSNGGRRKRTRRRLPVDDEKIVRSVLERAEQMMGDQDRSEWMRMRQDRYAKLRGWLEPKTWPWPDCSNVQITVIMAGFLRLHAGLFNATMARRPLMEAKSAKFMGELHAKREEQITRATDAQLFNEAPGFRRVVDDGITAFLTDANMVYYTPWVRDRRTIRELRFFPPTPPGQDELAVLLAQLDVLYPQSDITPVDGKGEPLPEVNLLGDGFHYRIDQSDPDDPARPQTVWVTIYDGERGGYEVEITYEAATYEGPAPRLLDIEDVLVPTRVGNLQPPSEANPHGAPYVFLKIQIRMDEVRRRMESGQFNRLTEADFDKILAAVKSKRSGMPSSPEGQSQQLKEQKDALEGTQHRELEARNEEEWGSLNGEFYLCFDRWAIRETPTDVQWIVSVDAKVLCEARYLSDLYPGREPWRPLSEAVFIPVPNRYYGISYLELMEPIYDVQKGIMDQNMDNGQITNLPTFFYSSSSPLKGERVLLAPGEGYGVPGDPRTQIHIPTWPQRDQTWAFNMFGLWNQMGERLSAQGGLQFGQVPPGKASALRTTGTTMALLQQGDVRSDEILLRLLDGFRQLWRTVHRLNRHYLPVEREFRLAGPVEPGQEAYFKVRREDLDVEADFSFEATFMNTDTAFVAQTMTDLLPVLVSPVTLQAGLTTPDKLYQLFADFVRSRKQDPSRYLTRPSGQIGPSLTFEEVVTLLSEGRPLPLGMQPLEGAEAALKKATALVQSDQLAVLGPEAMGELRKYLQLLQQGVSQARLLSAAQTFQAQQQGGQGGGGGTPTMMQEPEMTAAMAPAMAQGGQF